MTVKQHMDVQVAGDFKPSDIVALTSKVHELHGDGWEFDAFSPGDGRVSFTRGKELRSIYNPESPRSAATLSDPADPAARRRAVLRARLGILLQVGVAGAVLFAASLIFPTMATGGAEDRFVLGFYAATWPYAWATIAAAGLLKAIIRPLSRD